MNNRPLQPGDLCFILEDAAIVNGQDVKLPANQCALINRILKGSLIESHSGYVFPCSTDAWRVELLNGEYGIFPTYSLMRIDGNPDAETETVGEEEEIEV